MDNSDYLDGDGISKYQSMIGSLQWAVSLGRIDIQTTTMTLSSFRAIPQEGHIKGAICMYSYISNMRHTTIRIRTEEPDFCALPKDPNTWDRSIYGHIREEIPLNHWGNS